MPNPIQIAVFARSNRQCGFDPEQCSAGRRSISVEDTGGPEHPPVAHGPRLCTSRPSAACRESSPSRQLDRVHELLRQRFRRQFLCCGLRKSLVGIPAEPITDAPLKESISRRP